MPFPQVTDRIKETPAIVLRAVFAGVGQLLLAAEKIRARAMEQVGTAHRGEEAPRSQPPEHASGSVANVTRLHEPDHHAERLAAAGPPAATARAAAAPAAPKAPQSAAPRARPGTPPRGKPSAGAGRAPAKRPGGAEPTRPASRAVGSPPIPNYDELSIASLRARLRGLDAATLHVLVAYEKTHAARPDVIVMFERRLAKLAGEGS